MAKCEQGYLCDICGADVEHIFESDLYLRFVIGWIDPEVLHLAAERHIRCNPNLAQFVVDPEFKSVVVDGPLDKRRLDPGFVAERESLVTRGWHRLHQLRDLQVPITEYPLPEIVDRLKSQNG